MQLTSTMVKQFISDHQLCGTILLSGCENLWRQSLSVFSLNVKSFE